MAKRVIGELDRNKLLLAHTYTHTHRHAHRVPRRTNSFCFCHAKLWAAEGGVIGKMGCSVLLSKNHSGSLEAIFQSRKEPHQNYTSDSWPIYRVTCIISIKHITAPGVSLYTTRKEKMNKLYSGVTETEGRSRGVKAQRTDSDLGDKYAHPVRGCAAYWKCCIFPFTGL